MRDQERIARIQRAIADAGWDALVCSTRANVLLASGYWPVVGNAIAVVTREGRTGVLAPSDEHDFAARGWADELVSFEAGSLDCLDPVAAIVPGKLAALGRSLELNGGTLAYECEAGIVPVSYAAMFEYGAGICEVISQAFPRAKLVGAGDRLARLRASLTPHEVECVRDACRIAESAFTLGARRLETGMPETEAATGFRRELSPREGCGGFAWCMSGPNSALAHAAFARSRSRCLRSGDLVMIHCNSYLDGFWTDITRTFGLGGDDQREDRMYEAVFEARTAALAAIRPGARACDVDRAARSIIEARGFGSQFVHATGHGVGYSAINHNAMPRIHPQSPDILETGMTFNVEPAIYIEDWGGMRHCDVVTVTSTGVEVLTAFQSNVADLVIPRK